MLHTLKLLFDLMNLNVLLQKRSMNFDMFQSMHGLSFKTEYKQYILLKVFSIIIGYYR